MGNSQSIIIDGYSVRVGRQIGEGGYAYIYLAEDELGRKFALKRVIVPQGTGLMQRCHDGARVVHVEWMRR